MKKIAVFPGSFDPITKGHESIVLRAIPLFDEIIIAVGHNEAKKSFFSLEKRLEMLQQTFKNYPSVTTDVYSELTVDYCTKKGANYIVRGLRNTNDFNFESAIAQINKAMLPGIETVFLICSAELSPISSSIVRDIIIHRGDATPFLPSGLKL